MICARLLAVVGCLLMAHLSAAPLDDLRSPSQQVRDSAAQILRTSFVPTPRSQWEPIVAALKPGLSKESVLLQLAPYSVTGEGTLRGGGSTIELYRLDDVWTLKGCHGRSNDLSGTQLIEHLRRVWVAPAANFTGVWTTYFVNGQRSYEIHYRNGQHFGTFTSFHPDGSKSVVQHYGAAGVEGEGTGYFPSGAVKYRGQYSNGAQSGTWVWYNEDGSVESTQEYPDSGEAGHKPHGRD